MLIRELGWWLKYSVVIFLSGLTISKSRSLKQRWTRAVGQDSIPVQPPGSTSLLEVPRSTAYYQPTPLPTQDLALMRLIDEIHLQYPFYGSRRLCDELEDRGQTVNRKRVQRLVRLMGLQALYPRRRTSQPGKGHKIYPYLLRGLPIERANHVWATDITYIPMAKGFMYLVAIIDWYSRRVLSRQGKGAR